VRLLVALLALASCARLNETCSMLAPCLSGGYQFCKAGSMCSYHLTDGSNVNCASCADCAAAVTLVQKWCEPSTNPFDLGAPDLSSPALSIRKTAAYTGPKMNPMLDSATSCPDHDLEPNDLRAPIEVAAPPDQAAPKLVKMAICPSGTGDTDWFKVDLTGNLWLKAQLFYDVAYGDLDLAIVSQDLQILASDGSAVSNGCAVSPVGPGGVYVVVAGANNVEVNRYDVLINSYATPQACP
jgi:hypothetical protein